MLAAADRERLRALALAAIRHGLAHGHAPAVDSAAESPALQAPGACFVTLEAGGGLRGCIGSLEARRPLAEDVVQNAFAAAFRDPRFPPLVAAELPRVSLHLSVLSPPEPFPVQDEQDLLQRLQPGVDGLVLDDGRRRATFLPAVWEQLPDARDFVSQLKRKGGWPAAGWPAGMRVSRYRVEAF